MEFDLLKAAEWIWIPGATTEENQYGLFKVVFNCNPNDGKTMLRISVCGNYEAYLNGDLVAFSQYTDYPHKKTYTDVELDGSLRSGENELYIAVHFCGNACSSRLDGEPGIIAAVTQGDCILTASGDSWLVRRDTRFSNGPRERLFISFNYTYEFDARATLQDWTNAAVLPTRECTMLPRPIEPSVITGTKVGEIVARGTLLRTFGEYETNAFCYNADERDSDKGANGIYVTYDFGRESVGHLSIDLDLPAGTIVDITHGEHLTRGTLEACLHFTDRYISDGNKATFTHMLRRIGCRYIELHIIGAPEELKVPEVKLIEVELPNMVTPPFDASDPFWVKSHDATAETLRLCLHEKIENCPWREQSICMYDARNQMLFGYYYWGNYSKAAAMIDLFADGVRDDGFMPVTAPGYKKRKLSIPSYTFHWFTALYEYTLYSGDLTLFSRYRDLIREMLKKILALTKDGLFMPPMQDLWNYCEAPDLAERTDPPNAFYNLYLLESLRCLAELFAMTGDNGDAEKLRAIADKIAAKSPSYYYDEERGAYADSVLSDGRKDVFHSHINSLFMANGLVSTERVSKLIKNIDEGRLPMQALNSLIYLIKGAFEYGTDEDRLTVHKIIKEQFKKMLDTGSTTWWEVSIGEDYGEGGGSLCHGWSAVPAWYEGAIILGVTPLEPGFKRFKVKPHMCDLAYAKGKVPTPHGDILVEWHRTEDGNIDLKVIADGFEHIAGSDEWQYVKKSS